MKRTHTSQGLTEFQQHVIFEEWEILASRTEVVNGPGRFTFEQGPSYAKPRAPGPEGSRIRLLHVAKPFDQQSHLIGLRVGKRRRALKTGFRRCTGRVPGLGRGKETETRQKKNEEEASTTAPCTRRPHDSPTFLFTPHHSTDHETLTGLKKLNKRGGLDIARGKMG